MKQVFDGYYNDAVSQQVFADKIERSRAHVRNLIEQGVITVDKNGKISMSQGLASVNAYRQKALTNKERPQKKKNKALPDEDAEGDLALNDDKALQAMIDADPIDTYNRMRCLETAYKAKLKKLEYQEEAKQLYRVEEIRRDLLEVFTKIRGELLSIPQRVAGRCEGRDTREIEEILDNEINVALEHIQKSKFSEEAKPSRAGSARNTKAKA